jgi:hypothetical protein
MAWLEEKKKVCARVPEAGRLKRTFESILFPSSNGHLHE